MTEPIDLTEHMSDNDTAVEDRDGELQAKPKGVPSNEVYARVGDTVLRAVQERVRRGDRPEDVIREIVTVYDVRLTLGELRLLLAARRVPE